MKKTLLICFGLLLISASGVYLYFDNENRKLNNPVALCKASGGGWAPYWGQLDCKGNKMTAESDLVHGDKTCWCHTSNTCWNGNSCVSR